MSEEDQEHSAAIMDSVAQPQVTPPKSNMALTATKHPEAAEGKASVKPQVNLAPVQTITPPLFHHNLGKDQEEFERNTPSPGPAHTDNGPVIQFQAPLSPALTSTTGNLLNSQASSPITGTEDDTISEASSPIASAAEYPALDNIADAAEAARNAQAAQALIDLSNTENEQQLSSQKPLVLSSGEIDLIFEAVERKWDLAEFLLETRGRPLQLPTNRSLPKHRQVTTAPELIKRAKHFLDFRIPKVKPEQGRGVVDRHLFNTPYPWYEAKLMAMYGMLEDFPSGTPDVLYAIRQYFYDGKPSLLEKSDLLPAGLQKGKSTPTRRASKPKMPSVSAPTVAETPGRRVTRQTTAMSISNLIEPAENDVATPVHVQETHQVAASKEHSVEAPAPNQSAAEATQQPTPDVDEEPTPEPREKTTPRVRAPKKRKQATQEVEGADSIATKKKKCSRSSIFDESKVNPSAELLARHIKGMLNLRSSDKNDYAAFSEAILPDNRPDLNLSMPVLKHEIPEDGVVFEDVGDTSGLHPMEVQVCKILAITCDTYRCQKARFFLGLAVFTEWNYQAMTEDPASFKPWNAGKSQCQLINNMDVNKSSDMYQAFETWGWVEPVATKDPITKRWIVSQNYLRRFPEAHRRPLMRELHAYERAHPLLKQLAKLPPAGTA
ncbi:hypothetical protein ABEF95_009656 [Exophiala dermatitidis]